MDQAALEVLRVALTDVDSWHSVHLSAAGLDERGQQELAWHEMAFRYLLIPLSSEERRRAAGEFAPFLETPTAVYPPRPADQPPEVLVLWEETLGVIDHPLLAARYHDLLWIAEKARPALHKRYRHARGAIDAYVVLAERGSDHYFTATDSAARALELACQIRDNATSTRVAAAMTDRADTLLSAQPTSPGAPMQLLSGVIRAPGKTWPANLQAVLEHAETIPQQPPFLGDQVADMLAALVDAVERPAVRRRQLDRWDRWLARTKGIQRQMFLQLAYELAIRVLPEAAPEYLRALQEIDPAELEFKALPVEVRIPSQLVEEHLAWLVGDDGWNRLLARELASGPPSGKADQHATVLANLPNIAPLRFRFGRTLQDEAGRILRNEQTIDERLEGELRSQETLSMTVHARFLATALERGVERYGRPSEELLIELLSGPLVRPELALAMAHAISHYFAGDYDACIHSLAPRLECAIRELAQGLGVVVIALPEGDRGGGVRTLGVILKDLEGHLPEDWRRYLVDLLVDDRSLNLRNRVAHGLLMNATRDHAALLVHAAFLVASSQRESAMP